ncbi:SDR family NAD(P)-dependent oxidoreductase [Niabella aurantiaca]|uniref:SDR family NAD(P)-dependent oxidoreductase n=1 Tax=Niabella aurantiaca TaxID=379900 RepID=UPI0003721AE6|nr:SDR family oxidoreductase [Niabella aurantiaca]
MTNLKDKVAVVFAASGDIAGAVAQSLCEHGAKVYVTGRSHKSIKALAQKIGTNGGDVEAVQVDALNETEISSLLKKVILEHGRLDVIFNGIGATYEEMGGRPPTTVATFEQFMAPIEKICGSQFLTSRIAAKYMIESKSEGTILLLSAQLSKSKFPNVAGITAASAAIEGLTRVMAAEWGSNNIKVICICAGALMETKRISGFISDTARKYNIPEAQIIAQYKSFDIIKGNLTLKQVGETAAFLASDTGVAFNSHIVDVDCGKMNVL